MKFLNVVLILCCLFCLPVNRAIGSTPHSIKGVVITRDGTVVPEFSVVVRHAANNPALFLRKHFKNGEFSLDGLTEDKYQVLISSPLFVTKRFDLDFTIDERPTDYLLVILHTFRNEARLTPGAAYAVSLKTLKQKIPPTAVDAYEKGVELHRNGKLEEALVEYGKALRAYPNYVAALGDLGSIFVLYNRPDSALTFLRRAQDIDDYNPVINLNIANALTQQGDYGSALKLLKKVLHDQPQLALAHYYVGHIQSIQKKYNVAEASLRQAVQIDPTLLDAWLLIIRVSLDLKKYDEAREALMHVREA